MHESLTLRRLVCRTNGRLGETSGDGSSKKKNVHVGTLMTDPRLHENRKARGVTQSKSYDGRSDRAATGRYS